MRHEKWFELSETRYNGNITDWQNAVKKLRKRDLIEYMAYLYGTNTAMLEKVMLIEF